MNFKKGDKVALRTNPEFTGTIWSAHPKQNVYIISWHKPGYMGDELWNDSDLALPNGIKRAIKRLKCDCTCVPDETCSCPCH